LKEVARITKCTYIDLFPLFLDGQQYLDKKYTADGLHLKPEGYEVWVKYLRETGAL
jgi:lysophospholipase L1-like esterase